MTNNSSRAEISREACNYYSDADGPIVPPRLDDPGALARYRALMDESGLARVAEIDFDTRQLDDEIAGVPVVRLSAGPNPHRHKVLMHLHGGGFIIGSARGNASIPLQVAHAANIDVVSVDYRLAPEHPFPAALDDSLAVFRTLLHLYAPEKIGVLGESAGGGLAAALCLALRNAGDPLPGALALISPFADMTGSGESVATNDGVDPDLNWASLAPGAKAYAGDVSAEHPQVSPVFADYNGLPPTLIQVGSEEILLSDAIRIAEQAAASGVDVRLDTWQGMWHCFHFDPTLPEAQKACADVAQFLNTRLA